MAAWAFLDVAANVVIIAGEHCAVTAASSKHAILIRSHRGVKFFTVFHGVHCAINSEDWLQNAACSFMHFLIAILANCHCASSFRLSVRTRIPCRVLIRTC